LMVVERIDLSDLLMLDFCVINYRSI